MALGGRPKGAKNKLTASVKGNIVAVFTRLGATAAMADWAADHRTDFYRLYARLAPTELEVTAQVIDANGLTDAELAEIIARGSRRDSNLSADSPQESTPVH